MYSLLFTPTKFLFLVNSSKSLPGIGVLQELLQPTSSIYETAAGLLFDENKLNDFYQGITNLRNKGTWTKEDILSLFKNILPDFNHKETGKYLDQKM